MSPLATLMEVMADYKFVIGVENALARDYVTEKFFNPLLAGTVPVYRGAPNVEEFAPGRKCFVNAADFRSPAELADFMNRCYAVPALYDELTAWRERPLLPGFLQKLERVKEHPFVRLCKAVDTVKGYRKVLFQKLDVTNISEAIACAKSRRML